MSALRHENSNPMPAQLFVAALMAFALLLISNRVSHAQERLSHALPGLNAFLDDRYPGVRSNRTPLHVLSTDLDVPPDGIEEVVIGFAGVLFCGPAGCLVSITRREPDGTLTEIARSISREVEFRTGFVSGEAAFGEDLRRNPGIWGISGKTSGALKKR